MNKIVLMAAGLIVFLFSNVSFAGDWDTSFNKYIGIWAVDCANQDLFNVDLRKNALIVVNNGKRTPFKNLDTSVSAYLQEPNFIIWFAVDFPNEMGLFLEIWKDRKGIYGKISGHPDLDKKITRWFDKRLTLCSI